MVPEEIKEIIQKYTKSGWYHQRFDACPQFIYYIGESEVMDEPRKPAGTNANVRLAFYKDGKSDWYLARDDLKSGTEAIVNLAKSDPKIGSKIMSRWKKDEKNFNLFFKRFRRINLSKLSDKQLSELYKRFVTICFKRNSSSSIIDHFALGSDELISQMLRKEAGHLGRESEFTNLFAALTAPVHQSFLNIAEKDLLEIVDKVQRGKISEEKKSQLLNGYVEKYFWLQNNYFTSKTLDENYFGQEVEAWLKTGKNLSEQLLEIKGSPKINRQKKLEIFKKYNFSPLLRSLLTVSEGFTYWQDERKKCSFLTTYMGYEFISEIAKRKGYAADEIKFMLPSETINFLETRTLTKEELDKRKEFCAVLVLPEKSMVFTGEDAIAIKEMAISTKQSEEIKDIRGLVACTGRAVGTARVLGSATEIDKIKDGDILIAVMTRPDYVPAMKKAAAIVTDEGGITSHAAIVSRELGKPCIIGTKIATKVFKDGERIEVNANHNWIRRIT